MKTSSLLKISLSALLVTTVGSLTSCSTDPSSYSGSYQMNALSSRNYTDSLSPADRAFGAAAIGSGRSYP
ncbi:hypothetical protein [Prosthecobacter sp.]|uniref:hypothetical protein n=1 Tax=Prosthecobacter sp. TaxID=1965333 RepID=UPI003783DD02